MGINDDVQRIAILLLWYIGLGLDIGGLLRHGWRLARRQDTLESGWVQANPAFIEEARLRRNSEIFRCQIKAGMAVWALMVIVQRMYQGDSSPSSWFAWGILFAHWYLLATLYTWTARDR